MGETEHWELHGPGSVRVCDGAHATGCRWIAEAEIIGWPRDLAERRARLIAAAPDLLRAAQRLFAWPGEGECAGEWVDLKRAIAKADLERAIAKAEGRDAIA